MITQNSSENNPWEDYLDSLESGANNDDSDYEDENKVEVGELSAFRDELESLDISKLPDNPDEAKTEFSVIRKIIEELSEKYGVDILMHSSGDLGTPMALNHRLDALSNLSPRSFPLELTDAFQVNKMTEELAQMLYSKVVDEDKLKFYSGDKLQRLLVHVYRLIEVILYILEDKEEKDHQFIQKQHEIFWGNINSQNLLLGTLQEIAVFLEHYIQEKPLRDAEEMFAQGYLNEEISKWWLSVQDNLKDDYPQFLPEIESFVNKIWDKVSRLNPDQVKSKGYLLRVIDKMTDAIKLYPGDEGLELVLDETAKEDLILMIDHM